MLRLTPLYVWILCILTPSAFAQQDSPMAAFEAQNQAILEAETLAEVSHYLPEGMREHVAGLNEEQKIAALEAWKNDARALRPIRELVSDGTGAILIEKGQDLMIFVFERHGDEWTIVDEKYFTTAITGARGGFSVTGAVEYELEDGVIQQTGMNGVPVLVVSDQLGETLRKTKVPTVQLVLPTCPEPGSYSLEAVKAGGMMVRSTYSHPSIDGESVKEFASGATGKLTIEEIDGDRFSGRFTLQVKNVGDEIVTINGWLEDAKVNCDQS